MSKTTDEGLARLEHKVDHILIYLVRLMGESWPAPMKSGSHNCPVCKQVVKYLVDMSENSVTRQCGCKTGLMASIDLDKFAPPRAAGGKDDGEGREGSGDSAADGDVRGKRNKPQGRLR